MEPKLLEYYNRELTYMREMSGEFARAHPKIARRLGMQGIEVADPYVERLIEAFCFLSARVQIKLDAEFPNFTQRLLEVIYPNYVAPTPSMSVAQLEPAFDQGDFSKGFVLPKGSALLSRTPDAEKTAVEFRSSQDVRLWPLTMEQARLSGPPPDVQHLDRLLPAGTQVRGALRLRLKINGPLTFAQLQGLDELPIYLKGEDRMASNLMELLHTGAVATLIAAPGQFGQGFASVTEGAVGHVGLSPEQSVLPMSWGSFHGHNLLQAYFACPSLFYFFSLNKLAAGLSRIQGQEAEIIVLLNKAPGSLAAHVDAQQFALFCTPVVNLFPRRTDRLEVSQGKTEVHLVPSKTHPMDYEVFSVLGMSGFKGESKEPIEFTPMYQSVKSDEAGHGRYFSVRRQQRLASDSMRKYGTRTQYIGSEVFVSLVDQNDAPVPPDVRYLSVQALLTNRDLALLVPRNGVDDLQVPDSVPVRSCGLVRAPSSPRPSLAQGHMAWQLIRQLNLDYVSLSDLDERDGGSALRDLLGLFVAPDDELMRQQVSGVIGCKTQPVTRRLPGVGPLVYGRGVQVQTLVDETHFSGVSPYVFGLILEHYVARHVSMNVFTQLRLESLQRGTVAVWPVRYGQRNGV